MGSISKDEGRRYITRKLEGAGSRQPVFDDAAVEAILNSANGTARMINKICNRSMMIGASSGQNTIDAETSTGNVTGTISCRKTGTVKSDEITLV